MAGFGGTNQARAATAIPARCSLLAKAPSQKRRDDCEAARGTGLARTTTAYRTDMDTHRGTDSPKTEHRETAQSRGVGTTRRIDGGGRRRRCPDTLLFGRI